MFKFYSQLIFAWSAGIICTILMYKLLGKQVFKDGLLNIIKGIIDRLDKSIIGNDGNISSTRILSYAWGFGCLLIISIAVLRSITIQEGVLYLMGAIITVDNGKSIVNKMSEIKAVFQNKLNGDEKNGQA
jgi:hypothetical protein